MVAADNLLHSFARKESTLEIGKILPILIPFLSNFYFFSPNLPLIYRFFIHFSAEDGGS